MGQCTIVNYMKHFMISQLFDCVHNVCITALYWCGDTSKKRTIFGSISEGVNDVIKRHQLEMWGDELLGGHETLGGATCR